MAGIRFRGEFKTSTGTLYTIDIYDTEHVGDVTAFAIGAEGFVLNYRGENADMMNPVLGSELEFDMAIADETMEAFISDIAESPESRFWLGVYEGVGGQDLFWCGIISPDIARLEDEYYPYFFKVKAADGFAFLRAVEYRADDFQPIEGDARIIEIIERCLNYLPHVPHYFDQAQYFIRTAVNWYEANHTYSVAYDPLYYTYADNRVTYSTKDPATWEKGTQGVSFEWMSVYDVLLNLLTIFGARIMHTEGVYLIEQIETRAEATFYSRYYGYPTSTPTADDLQGSYNITPGSTRRKLNGGYFSWFQALTRAELEYDVLNRRNFMPPKVFTGDETDLQSPGTTDTKIAVKATGTNRFKITGQFTMTIQPDGYLGNPLVGQQIYFIVFYVIIKLDGTPGYFLRRQVTPKGPGQFVSDAVSNWSSSFSQYEVASQPFKLPFIGIDQPVTITVPFHIITPHLPGNGTLRVGCGPVELYGPNGSTGDIFDSFFVSDEITDYAWELQDAYIEMIDDDISIATANTLKYIATNPYPGSSTTYKSSVIWADGTDSNSFGRLKVDVSGTLTDTANWGVKTTSGTKLIQNLLLERIIRLQQNPTRKMYTTVYGPDFSIWKTLVDSDSIKWMFLGGQYTSNVDEWQGEWFAIGIRSGDDVVFAEVPKDDLPGGLPNPPGIAPPGGTDALPPAGIAPYTLAPLSSAELYTELPSGATSYIELVQTLAEDAFISGEKLILYNPQTGDSEELIVTGSVNAGDTTVGVYGNLGQPFPIGSFIIRTPKNDIEQGGVGPPGGGSGGTVTSVAVTMPTDVFDISGSPITTFGTIAITLDTQTANTVFSGPTTGGAATPTFRALVAADIPSLDTSKLTSGTLAVARGGTGLSALGSALQVVRVNAGGTALEYATPTSGTVTSVALSMPTAVFDVSGSPITSSGTLTVTLDNQNPNWIFAGPTTGSPATPAFRALVSNDIPSLDVAKITSGTFAVARGGTGLSSLGSALQVLRVNAGGTALEYATPSSGTVTSVALTPPGSLFATSGSPITTSGTIILTLQNQTANNVFAGPTSGSPGTPTFRALVAADIPAISALSGSLSLSQISTAGATTDYVIRYNGSAWASSADKWTTSGSDIYRNSGVTVGGTNVAVAKLNAEGMTAGVGLRVSPGSMSVGNKAISIEGTATTEVYGMYCDMGVVGHDLVCRIRNSNNSNTSSGTLLHISARDSGGDPAVRLEIEGGSFWQMTTDNSDSDAFVISYNTGPNVNQPLKINSTGVTIIRQLSSPSATLTVAMQAGAGSGASGSTLGGECFFILTFTTGTGTAAGNQFIVTLPRSVPGTLIPVFSAANSLTSAEITKLYWSASSGNTFTISASPALTASTTYALCFMVGGS